MAVNMGPFYNTELIAKSSTFESEIKKYENVIDIIRSNAEEKPVEFSTSEKILITKKLIKIASKNYKFNSGTEIVWQILTKDKQFLVYWRDKHNDLKFFLIDENLVIE